MLFDDFENGSLVSMRLALQGALLLTVLIGLSP